MDAVEVADPTALAIDPFGRAFATQAILRLDPGGAVPFAGQGTFAPASSIAVDARARLCWTGAEAARRRRAGGGDPRTVRERKGLASRRDRGGRRPDRRPETAGNAPCRPDGTDRPTGSVVGDPTRWRPSGRRSWNPVVRERGPVTRRAT